MPLYKLHWIGPDKSAPPKMLLELSQPLYYFIFPSLIFFLLLTERWRSRHLHHLKKYSSVSLAHCVATFYQMETLMSVLIVTSFSQFDNCSQKKKNLFCAFPAGTACKTGGCCDHSFMVLEKKREKKEAELAINHEGLESQYPRYQPSGPRCFHFVFATFPPAIHFKLTPSTLQR